MQENSSDFDGDSSPDMRLNGPMLRKLFNFEERFLVRSGSSSWKEFMGTAVARARDLPILCSMVANGDSRFPNTTPLGKSPSRTALSPGIKSAISWLGPAEPEWSTFVPNEIGIEMCSKRTSSGWPKRDPRNVHFFGHITRTPNKSIHHQTTNSQPGIHLGHSNTPPELVLRHCEKQANTLFRVSDNMALLAIGYIIWLYVVTTELREQSLVRRFGAEKGENHLRGRGS
ncbi:hypothetical protein HanPSC8_Chr08g0338091 [Helianthus annuus]|nr:hypothetical protein HanPSC8_Chr08g0338091 [Helianthus annuus]